MSSTICIILSLSPGTSCVLVQVIIVLLVLRGLLFSSVWFFGYELWVLPNVLSEDEGVDMFKPLVTFKRSKGVRNWHRALAVVFLAL